MTKRDESSKDEIEPQQTPPAKEEHTRGQQQSKGEEKRQAKEGKKTKKRTT